LLRLSFKKVDLTVPKTLKVHAVSWIEFSCIEMSKLETFGKIKRMFVN